MKLPIRTLGLMASALLIGSALSTAVAQGQQSGPDGQVALRSDGALYLIMNGQRRWISTVQLADSDINAIPEGDPIMVGLAPLGSAEAAAPAKPSTGAAGSTAAPPPPSSASASAPKPSPTPPSPPASASAPATDPGEELSADLPIEVDLDGATRIDLGDERRVDVKTKAGFTCELKMVLPGGDTLTEDSKNADSSGKCKYTIQVPDDAKDGDGKLIGTVRAGGKVNRQEIAVQIGKKKN